MLTDLDQLLDGETLTADVCIVGAGAAGISMAREFLGTDTTVLLLEGGGMSSEAETQALYGVETIGVPFPGALEGRAREFGGTTTLWGGTTIPLDARDFVPKAWIPHSGWPLGRGELDPYYRRAERVLQLDGYCYDERVWPRLGLEPPELDPDKLRLVFSKEKTWPFRPKVHPKDFRSVYRSSLVDAPNIHVVLHANATSIRTVADGSTVDHIEVRTLRNTVARARAEVYVLACGGIETPRLLLASAADGPGRLGNDTDLVGRYFMGHPRFEAATIASDQARYLQHRFDSIVKERQLFRSRLELSERLLEKEQLPQCDADIVFEMPEESGIRAAIELYKGVLGRRRPDDARRNVRRAIRGLPEVVTHGAQFLASGRWPTPAPSTITLLCRSEQYPDPESRITLSDRHDALGQPRARIEWRLTERERDVARLMAETVGEEFERLDLGVVTLADWMHPEVGSWREHVSEGHHHSGTTRMAESPESGVVDPNCRVFGVDNLFVTGSSVFPTTGTANPTFTIIALAIRLADHLKQR